MRCLYRASMAISTHLMPTTTTPLRWIYVLGILHASIAHRTWEFYQSGATGILCWTLYIIMPCLLLFLYNMQCATEYNTCAPFSGHSIYIPFIAHNWHFTLDYIYIRRNWHRADHQAHVTAAIVIPLTHKSNSSHSIFSMEYNMHSSLAIRYPDSLLGRFLCVCLCLWLCVCHDWHKIIRETEQHENRRTLCLFPHGLLCVSCALPFAYCIAQYGREFTFAGMCNDIQWNMCTHIKSAGSSACHFGSVRR